MEISNLVHSKLKFELSRSNLLSCPEEPTRRFDDWCSRLPLLQVLKIPRAFFSGPVEKIEMLMFCDCSKNNFCDVVFLRAISQGSNTAHLSLVVSKTRFAPMKPIIPKVELHSALLADHLRQKIFGALTFDVPQSFMLTDSRTRDPIACFSRYTACFCCKPRSRSSGNFIN